MKSSLNPIARWNAVPSILIGWAAAGLLWWGMLGLLPGAPGLVFTSLFVLTTAVCGGFSALALKLPGRKFWQGISTEILIAAVLTGIYLSGLYLLFHVTTLGDLPALTNVGATSAWLLAAACMPGFLLARLVMRAWVWWRDLCQRHYVWQLTHAILMVIAAVAVIALFALFIYSFQLRPAVQTPQVTISQVVFWTVSLLAMGLLAAGVGMILFLPLAAAFSYRVARHLTARVQSLSKAVVRMSQGDLSVRLAVDGRDEVALLQNHFNLMAERLQANSTELEAEKEKVTALLKAQQELTAGVSHEIRTPAAVILGYLDSLQTGWKNHPPERVDHDLEAMKHEAERLRDILNDLMTLSQSELDRLQLKVQPTRVVDIVDRLVKVYADLAWESGRVEVIALPVEGEIPSILVDPLRLEQVLVNLIRNAVRYTPPGGLVSLGVSADGGWVTLEVADTGAGIPADSLDVVWQKFYRVEGVDDTGSGLGLALVRELTESMGGQVGVESVPGQGSSFRVSFPYK
jgi:signal transduction histidine kinase